MMFELDAQDLSELTIFRSTHRDKSWKCETHGDKVTHLGMDWTWYPADGNHRRGRYVCFACRIGCEECCDERKTIIPIIPTAHTKERMVSQIIGQALRSGLLRGYLPKTDISRALREVYRDE